MRFTLHARLWTELRPAVAPSSSLKPPCKRKSAAWPGARAPCFWCCRYQTELVNAQAAEIRARADYNKALSQLGFAEAGLLESHGFTLDIR